MRQFLQVSIGPYRMLLDAEGIHELLEIPPSDQAGSIEHRDWRGQVLTVVNGRRLLGLQNSALQAAHAGVVYSAVADEDVPVMLEVDAVDRLRQVELNDLSHLPALPESVARLFDCVLSDAGVQYYHLRRPLDLLAVIELERQKAALVKPVVATIAPVELPESTNGEISVAEPEPKPAPRVRRNAARRKK